jgi:hypothetical protein
VPSGKPGLLTVNAPEGAAVYLDGKRIGTGSMKREIPGGPHRVDVRLGGAEVGEAFTMEPGGTYSYEITPQ